MKKLNKALKVLIAIYIIISFASFSFAQESVGKQTIVKVIIPAGASISAPVDIWGYRYITIFMPSAWTTANITFLSAPTFGGQTYASLYNDLGTEVNITAAASRTIAIDTNALTLAGLRYIKIRSGTASTPVAQASERTIYLILKG